MQKPPEGECISVVKENKSSHKLYNDLISHKLTHCVSVYMKQIVRVVGKLYVFKLLDKLGIDS